MALELRHLRLVTAVSAEGGLTRAAGVLHLTQSALSHQLRELEERLGTRLFLRLGKRMVPTPAGERVRAAAGPLLDDVARVEEEIGRLAGGQEGVLRLATECYTCYHWIPAILKELRRRRPKVEVRIVAEATRRPIEALLAGRIDLAIGSSTRSGPAARGTAPIVRPGGPGAGASGAAAAMSAASSGAAVSGRDPRLTVRTLFDDEMVAVLSPTHPLAGRTTLAPADFRDEVLILYVPPSESTVFKRVFDPAGVKPREVMQVPLTEAIVELVKAGLGVSVLARWAVSPQIREGSLRAIPITGRGLRRRWYAARLRDPSAPDYLDEFVDLLAAAGRP